MQATEWTGLKNHLNQAVWDEIGEKIGRARANIFYFVSGRAGLGPKFQFLFRAGQDCSHAGRAQSEKSGPCRPLVLPHNQRSLFIDIKLCDTGT